MFSSESFFMIAITDLDLLIVYSERIATSSNSLVKNITAPFSKESGRQNYNDVYGYFLEKCQKEGLRAAFTTSNDIIGPGKCRSYWLYLNKTWVKVQKNGYSVIIFDKISSTKIKLKASRALLFSSNKIKPFNNPDLFDLCFDKQKTCDRLTKYSIPTITIANNTRHDVNFACKELNETKNNHLNKKDFANQIVMKDRFGAGGLNVYKFRTDQIDKMASIAKKHKGVSFIIQPFVKFDKGLITQNYSFPTDIRLVYLRNKIVQAYLRIAKKGEFRCNEHRGGLLKYIPLNEVPLSVLTVSDKIINLLNTQNSLFALDFIISNNGNVYLLEANTGPGLDWNIALKENEIEAKKLIDIIVKEIKKRISIKTTNYHSKTLINSINIPIFTPLHQSL